MIFQKGTLLLLSFLLNCFIASGQNLYPSLVLGSEVPDIRFNRIGKDSTSVVSISDFRGKIVVLDFWATWCTSCINTFPKLDSLQREFGESVQFILVNCIKGSGDSKSKITQFIKSRREKGKIVPDLPIVTDDSLIKKYFPYTFVPHYVWISPDGKLLAITSGTFVNREAILEILNRYTNKG
jgi:thiol-disulfide isomerase/thioredoxin